MSDRLSVHGRTVCITGSSSGMGRDCGTPRWRRDRLPDGPQRRAHGGQARIEAAGGKADLAFDVPTLLPCRRGSTSRGRTRRLDVMINAGFGDFGASFLGGVDIWKGMLDVNVLALTVGSQAAVAAMRATESQGNIADIEFDQQFGSIPREVLVLAAVGNHAACEVNSRTADPCHVDHAGVFATNFSRNVGDDMMGMIAGMAGVENVDDDEAECREMLAQLAATCRRPSGMSRTSLSRSSS